MSYCRASSCTQHLVSCHWTASGKARFGIFLSVVSGVRQRPGTGASPLTSRACLSLLTKLEGLTLEQLRHMWSILA